MVATRLWIHPSYRHTSAIPLKGVQTLVSLSAPSRGLGSMVRSVRPIYIMLLSLTGLTISMALGAIAVFFAVGGEPVSRENPMFALESRFRAADRSAYFAALSREEKRKLANKVEYVSALIGKYNRKLQEKNDLALSIVTESVKANYDPLLVTAIVKSESTFKRHALSHKGARGLMQLLPTTERYASNMTSKEFFPGFKDLHLPDTHIERGIAYFKYLEDQFGGDRELALIAWNWGPGNLKSALKRNRRIPAEPVKFAKKVLQNHHRWRADYQSLAANFRFITSESIA